MVGHKIDLDNVENNIPLLIRTVSEIKEFPNISGRTLSKTSERTKGKASLEAGPSVSCQVSQLSCIYVEELGTPN